MEGVTHGIREASAKAKSAQIVPVKETEQPKAKYDANTRLLGKYGFDKTPPATKEKAKSKSFSFFFYQIFY